MKSEPSVTDIIKLQTSTNWFWVGGWLGVGEGGEWTDLFKELRELKKYSWLKNMLSGNLVPFAFVYCFHVKNVEPKYRVEIKQANLARIKQKYCLHLIVVSLQWKWFKIFDQCFSNRIPEWRPKIISTIF